LTFFGAKMSAEGAKRRPRGASGGGLFLELFFKPPFESNLGPKGEGAYPYIFTLLPPLTLSTLVLPLKGTPSSEPLSAKALSGTCNGRANRKVPKVTMAAFQEKMWTCNL